jgi:AcrR family transcriptional regulator
MVDHEEVRKRIIEASRAVFARYGYRKTSMDEIALALAMGKSSLYYYFKSKEEIFIAVIDKESGLLTNEVQNAVDAASQPIDKMKIYVLTRLSKVQELANFYSAIKNDFMANFSFIETIRKKYDQQEIHMIRSIIEEGVRTKQFKVDDPELAAIAIVTAMKGLEMPIYHSHKELSAEKRVNSLIDFLFYGLIKPGN